MPMNWFFVCGGHNTENNIKLYLFNGMHKIRVIIIGELKLKSIFIVLVSFLFLIIGGCSTALDVPTDITNAVSTYYDGYLDNDSNKIASVMANDYKSIGYPTKEDIRDIVQEINFVKFIHNWHSNLTIEKNSVESYASTNGYKVYVTGVENFKHNETGKQIDLRFSDVWSVNRSGKIQSRERFQDIMDYWSDIDFGISKEKEVTFLADMSKTEVQKGTGDVPAVYIVSGPSTGPSGVKMVQGNNNIWSGTVMLSPGTHAYKFRKGFYIDWGLNGWEDGEIFKANKCGFNQWGDREVLVSVSDEQTIGPFCFNSCDKCD